MSSRRDSVAEEGLRFFGRISASITHEVKNALAIIHENAGLLQDFCLLAEKGKPVDTSRFKELVGKLLDQVGRADDIVKNMNRFAHSVDESRGSVELSEEASFVATLSNRAAAMKGVTLEAHGAREPVYLETNPFALENLIWCCLDFAMGAVGDDKTLTISTDKAEQGGKLRFTNLGGLAEATSSFPGEREEVLLEALRGELVIDMEKGQFEVLLTALDRPR